MGSMAQTGLLLVPSDALGHTWALPGVLGAGPGLPPPTEHVPIATRLAISLKDAFELLIPAGAIF